MPILTDAEMFFYREDLCKESNRALPKTIPEYLEKLRRSCIKAGCPVRS